MTGHVHTNGVPKMLAAQGIAPSDNRAHARGRPEMERHH